jgi:hypothetical protein
MKLNIRYAFSASHGKRESLTFSSADDVVEDHLTAAIIALAFPSQNNVNSP